MNAPASCKIIRSVLVLLVSFPGFSVVAADPVHDGHKPTIVLAEGLKWVSTPALPPEIKVSMLYGNLTKAEPIGFRIKLPAGGILAPHTHPVHERVTVISGNFSMGEGERFDKSLLKDMPVGSMAIFPKGCPMFGMAREETVIQVNAEGPWGITYVNPADDPRNKK